MTFFERYAKIAEDNGLIPGSQKAADLFGVTRSAISSWNTKSTTPKGSTVALIADNLGVSTDYLLGRTDDPTDYAKEGFPSKQATPAPAKTVPIRDTFTPDVDPNFLILYSRLDAEDKIKAVGVLQGMLMQDKYVQQPMTNAAHMRTDIRVTQEMIDHDEDIMDDENF